MQNISTSTAHECIIFLGITTPNGNHCDTEWNLAISFQNRNSASPNALEYSQQKQLYVQ